MLQIRLLKKILISINTYRLSLLLLFMYKRRTVQIVMKMEDDDGDDNVL